MSIIYDIVGNSPILVKQFNDYFSKLSLVEFVYSIIRDIVNFFFLLKSIYSTYYLLFS